MFDWTRPDIAQGQPYTGQALYCWSGVGWNRKEQQQQQHCHRAGWMARFFLLLLLLLLLLLFLSPSRAASRSCGIRHQTNKFHNRFSAIPWSGIHLKAQIHEEHPWLAPSRTLMDSKTRIMKRLVYVFLELSQSHRHPHRQRHTPSPYTTPRTRRPTETSCRNDQTTL